MVKPECVLRHGTDMRLGYFPRGFSCHVYVQCIAPAYATPNAYYSCNTVYYEATHRLPGNKV
jgi:hypothetical protein